MKKLPLLLVGAALVPAAVLIACATDNGDNVYGDQFGPTPQRPDATADRSSPEDDGSVQPEEEGGTDGGPDAPSSCADGMIAVLAGSASGLTGAVQDRGGAWKGAPIPGGAALSTPALVAFGSGFLGVTRGAGNTLQSTTYTSAWSAPATFGVAGVKTAPSLTVVGTKAHVVYSAGAGAAANFVHGINAGSGWDGASEPVGSAMGVAPVGLAQAGADLGFAQAGTNNGLYFLARAGTTWTSYVGPDGIEGIDGAGAAELASPALVSVDGKFDVVLVYADKDGVNKLRWVGRDATSKTFTAPADVNGSNTNYASTLEPIAIARVSPFTLLATFRGTDGKGYYVSGTLSPTTINWTSPAPLATGGVAVDETPRPAKGVCGDDGVIAFASAGQVKLVRLRGSALTAPEPVTGASGARVAIATR